MMDLGYRIGQFLHNAPANSHTQTLTILNSSLSGTYNCRVLWINHMQLLADFGSIQIPQSLFKQPITAQESNLVLI